MMWSLLREISFRHLRRSPLRTGLVIFGIALGVSMLSAVLSTNASLLAAFQDMVRRVAGKADLTVAGGASGIPNSLTAEIAAVDGVAHAAAMVEVTTRTTDDQAGTLLVLGVDFLGDTFFLPFAQPGQHQVVTDPLAFVNDPRAVLVSKRLARDRTLSIGSPLPLLTPEGELTFYVRGVLEDSGPAASFGGQVVVMFLDALQVSFARGELVDRIDVAVAEGADVEAAKKRIHALVAGRAEVERPTGRSARLATTLWVFRNGLSASGLAALWVGMFLIYNAVSVNVAQRRREIGILRALGVTRGGVTGLFCLEALAMALLGGLIGLVVGGRIADLALASAVDHVSQFMLPMRPPPAHITPQIAVVSIAAGLGATVLAAFFPARKSASIDPAEALRATRASSTLSALPERKLALIGLVVSLAACVPAWLGGELNGYLASTAIVSGLAMFVPLCVRFLHGALVRAAERLLGVPGRLALDNVARSAGRSAVTVIAMMLAISMSMTIGTYARSFQRSVLDWADQAFAADAVVVAGSPLQDRQHVPFAPSVLEKLRTIEGVAGVNPNRVAAHHLFGRRVDIDSKDSHVVFDELRRRGRRPLVLAGPKDIDADALSGAPRVLISENLSRATGLGVGDRIRFNTPTGERSFEVYAVVIDYGSDTGALFMDRKWYRQYFRDEQIDSVDLLFEPGADPEEVVKRVRARLGAHDALFVTLAGSLREHLKQVAGNVLALTRAPEVVTLIVALMGVIGTMLAGVIDRIREIGLLRAVGASRRQILASVIAEAAFLGVAATLCGIAAGVPQGFIFLKVIGISTSGWNLTYTFPVETALRVGLAILAAAALAGVLPGLRAARLDVRDALSYE